MPTPSRMTASTSRHARPRARGTRARCRGSRCRPDRRGCCGSSAAAASRRTRRAGRPGSGSSSRSRDCEMRSAVSTPQPPAVVSTNTRGPRGSGWHGEAGRDLERLLDGGGAAQAGLTAHAVEDLVVGGERAGVRGCGALSAGGHPALQHDDRLLRRGRARLLEEAAAVGEPLDVDQAHVGCRIVDREVLEVVGDRGRRRVAGRNRAADADPGRSGIVQERLDEAARLASDGDPPGRRVRCDDLCAQRDRRRDDPLPVRPREQDAELGAEVGERALGAQALRPRLAEAGRADEGGLDALRRARAQELRQRCGRRAHEDQVGDAVGNLVDRAERLLVEDGAALAIGEEHLARRSRARGCCARRRSRTCRDGSMRRRR